MKKRKFALFLLKSISPCAVLVDSARVEYPIFREYDDVMKEEFYKIDYINGFRDVYAPTLNELLHILRHDLECKISEIK